VTLIHRWWILINLAIVALVMGSYIAIARADECVARVRDLPDHGEGYYHWRYENHHKCYIHGHGTGYKIKHEDDKPTRAAAAGLHSGARKAPSSLPIIVSHGDDGGAVQFWWEDQTTIMGPEVVPHWSVDDRMLGYWPPLGSASTDPLSMVGAPNHRADLADPASHPRKTTPGQLHFILTSAEAAEPGLAIKSAIPKEKPPDQDHYREEVSHRKGATAAFSSFCAIMSCCYFWPRLWRKGDSKIAKSMLNPTCVQRVKEDSVMRLATTGAVLAFMAAAPVMAADLRGPNTDYVKARETQLPPIYSWTGLYLGGWLGGSWGSGNETFPKFGGNPTGTATSNPGGFIGGAMAEYLYQFANSGVVVGADLEGAWGNLTGTGTVATAGPFSITDGTVVDNMVSATAKLGYAFNPFLFYVKGGWVGANVMDQGIFSNGVNSITIADREWMNGYLLGGGVDWRIYNNTVAFAEADYYNLGTSQFFANSFGPNVAINKQVDGWVGKVGLKFLVMP
jgi:outer membrane immunogenic protein